MILAPVLRQKFFDANGNPLVGGKLYSYVAGTTTPQATYTDAGGGTPNANPVILDAKGEANVWLDSTLAYKFVLTGAADEAMWSVDQVSGAGQTGISTWNVTSDYQMGDIVRDDSGEGLLYVSLLNDNVGHELDAVDYWRMYDGSVRTITANDDAAVADNLIRSNSTAGNISVTLPSVASTPIGKQITVKDIGTGGNTTSVKGSGSEQVDGANTYATALDRYDSVTVMNNGTGWDAV